MNTCASSATAAPGFSGAWATEFERLDLDVGPDGAVRGSYAYMDGRVEGRVEGLVLRGRWVQPGNDRAGDLELTLGEGSNTFTGAWRYEGDSPLANDPWRVPAGGQDPYILAEIVDRVNYGLVDVDLARAGSEILLLLKGEDGGTLIEQPIALASLEICYARSGSTSMER